MADSRNHQKTPAEVRRRKKLLEQHAAQMAALSPAELAEERADVELWDVTLLDGLENDPWEG